MELKSNQIELPVTRAEFMSGAEFQVQHGVYRTRQSMGVYMEVDVMMGPERWKNHCLYNRKLNFLYVVIFTHQFRIKPIFRK